MDELDQEVAFISKMHQEKRSKNKNKDLDGVVGDQANPIANHNDINVQLEDEDQMKREIKERLFEEEQEFRDALEKGIINDDEDDMRILDSLPTSYKPRGLPQQDSRGKNTQNQSKKEEYGSNEPVEFQPLGPLSRFLEKIVVVGFNCNAIPAITNLTYFMNHSFFLHKHKRTAEATEIDFLVGVLLITTKRATQAAELYRKVESALMRRIAQNMAQLELMAR